MDPESQAKTAFWGPDGLYEFVRIFSGSTLPQPPTSEPWTRHSGACLLPGPTWTTSLCTAAPLLTTWANADRLRQASGLQHQAAPRQVQLPPPSTASAGAHHRCRGGWSPTLKRCQPSRCQLRPPTPVSLVRTFLGMTGFYRHCIKGFGHIANALTLLLHNAQPWVWSPEQQLAFDTLRTALVTGPCLRCPDFSQPFILSTD